MYYLSRELTMILKVAKVCERMALNKKGT